MMDNARQKEKKKAKKNFNVKGILKYSGEESKQDG